MAAAHVQHAVGDEWFTSDTTITVTWGSNTTTGNLIVVGIFWSSATVTIATVTDSQSNPYTVLSTPVTGGGWSGQIAYAPNITGGTTPTITVTFSGAIANKNVLPLEISGCDPSSPLDGFDYQFTGAGAGTDIISTAAYTTTEAGDYLAGFVIQHEQHNNISAAGTGYTLRAQNNAHSQRATSESQIQTTASASTVATWTTTGFSNDLVLGAAFKVAGGGEPLPDWELRLDEPELGSGEFE